MAKIRIMSDLHMEFGPFNMEPVDCDVVVLAGDTNLGTAGVRWAMENIKEPVVYLLGNHE
jgi:predicted phosphodiesterase